MRTGGKPGQAAILWALAFTLASCWTRPSSPPGSSPPEGETRRGIVLTGVAPGTVQIDLIEEGTPERYWVYAITPQQGTIRLVSTAEFPDRNHESIPEKFHQPTGAIHACSREPAAVSPNGKYVARCLHLFVKTDKFSGIDHDVFVVEDKVTGSELFHWQMEKERRIRGFSWSPDSSSVAILNLRLDYTQFAFLGHQAIPHDSVCLDIIGFPNQFAEYTVRRDVPYAFTRILDWAVP